MSAAWTHVLYALAWAGFGLLHSLLARTSVKNALRPSFGPFQRLAYNGVATVHLTATWIAGWVLFDGSPPFALPGWGGHVLTAVYLCGWILMAISLAGYDLGRLGGSRQIRNHFKGVAEPEDEPLRRDGLHQFVRHPLYCAGFLILWGRVADEFSLATAIWGSAYLLVGTIFEERWLLNHHGREYADYRERVPAFIPWKGRC